MPEESTREFLWYDNLAMFSSTWNEITLPLRFMLSPEVQEQAWTTRLRPCQGVISETCPASICHCCYIWFSQPWGKTVRSFWWTAGVLSSQPVWDVSPQGIRWFIRTFRLLVVGWGPGGPRRHECNGMPSPPFSSCLKRKPICEHPFMIRIGDKSSDTSWACKGIWCLYLTKDENNWWTHVWIKNCNSLDNVGRVKRVRTTRWSLLRIALAFLSLATTSFGRWVIAACFKCEVNLEQGIVRISWGRRKNRKVSDGIESFHTLGPTNQAQVEAGYVFSGFRQPAKSFFGNCLTSTSRQPHWNSLRGPLNLCLESCPPVPFSLRLCLPCHP